MRTNWTSVARAGSGKIAKTGNRVLKPTGWGGGYKRPAPKGAHKCLSRTDMAAVIAAMR